MASVRHEWPEVKKSRDLWPPVPHGGPISGPRSGTCGQKWRADVPRGPAPNGDRTSRYDAHPRQPRGIRGMPCGAAQLPVSFSRRAARASSEARVPSDSGTAGRLLELLPVSLSDDEEDEPESEE
jgi:hypothetical protein